MTNDEQPKKLEEWAQYPKELSDLHFYYPFDAVYEDKGLFQANPHVKVFFRSSPSGQQELYVHITQIGVSSKISRTREGGDRVIYAVRTEIYTDNPSEVHDVRFKEEHPIETVKGLSLNALLKRNADGLSDILCILGYPPLIKKEKASGCIAHVVGGPERYFSIGCVGLCFGFIQDPVEYFVRH